MELKNLSEEKRNEHTKLMLSNTPAELALKVMQLSNMLRLNTDLLVEKNAELARKEEEIARLHAKAAINTAARI